MLGGLCFDDDDDDNNNNNNNNNYYYYCYYYYSALGLVWAGTRAQSGDWYGSGTLHPGQLLGGRLPLLSPVSFDISLILQYLNYWLYPIGDDSYCCLEK